MSDTNESMDTDDPPENGKFYVEKKILKECYDLYNDKNEGLIEIGLQLGLCRPFYAPMKKKKTTVLLIGDPSAGKSSFINWYVGEDVRKTGVASEREKICLVTSGKKRQSFMGKTALHVFGLITSFSSSLTDEADRYLSTEISASDQKGFGLIAFVDTPGSKDPTDWLNKEDSIILQIGDTADLIFVFLDPTGQTLTDKTLNLVKHLSLRNGKKMRFCLSKADKAGDESDRERVIKQIVGQLKGKATLDVTESDIRTIYIPELNKTTECTNQIEKICYDIEEAISRTIQITLHELQSDCNRFNARIRRLLDKTTNNRYHNQWIIFWMVCAIVVIVASVWTLLRNLNPHLEIIEFIGPFLILTLIACICFMIFSFFLYVLTVLIYPSFELFREVIPRKAEDSFQERLCQTYKIERKIYQLHLEYMKQSVSDLDLSDWISDPLYYLQLAPYYLNR